MGAAGEGCDEVKHGSTGKHHHHNLFSGTYATAAYTTGRSSECNCGQAGAIKALSGWGGGELPPPRGLVVMVGWIAL